MAVTKNSLSAVLACTMMCVEPLAKGLQGARVDLSEGPLAAEPPYQHGAIAHLDQLAGPGGPALGRSPH